MVYDFLVSISLKPETHNTNPLHSRLNIKEFDWGRFQKAIESLFQQDVGQNTPLGFEVLVLSDYLDLFAAEELIYTNMYERDAYECYVINHIKSSVPDNKIIRFISEHERFSSIPSTSDSSYTNRAIPATLYFVVRIDEEGQYPDQAIENFMSTIAKHFVGGVTGMEYFTSLVGMAPEILSHTASEKLLNILDNNFKHRFSKDIAVSCLNITTLPDNLTSLINYQMGNAYDQSF